MYLTISAANAIISICKAILPRQICKERLPKEHHNRSCLRRMRHWRSRLMLFSGVAAVVKPVTDGRVCSRIICS